MAADANKFRLFAVFAMVLCLIFLASCGVNSGSSDKSLDEYSSAGTGGGGGSSGGTGSGTGGGTGGGTGSASTGSEGEQYCLELVNEERQKAGLSALQWDTKLAEVAKWFAQDKNDNEY